MFWRVRTNRQNKEEFVIKRYRLVLWFALLFLPAIVFAKGKSEPSVVNWPSAEKTLVRFTFGPVNGIGGTKEDKVYQTQVEAVNLWSKELNANFDVFIYDANHARVGTGYITLTRVRPNQTVKFMLTFDAVGNPASLEVNPNQLPPELMGEAPPKAIRITVYSVPSGADVKVDGKAMGTTPVQIAVVPGKHELEFSKVGFSTGSYPLVISPDDASGGSVTYELGSASRDTVELRDGTLITGDLISVDAQQVVVRVGGEAKAFDRNQVKRILLIERQPLPPNVATPK